MQGISFNYFMENEKKKKQTKVIRLILLRIIEKNMYFLAYSDTIEVEIIYWIRDFHYEYFKCFSYRKKLFR